MGFENASLRIAGAGRLLLVFVLSVSGLCAHGLGVGVEVTDGLVVIQSRYADGTFADAEVMVYSPQQPNKTFQIGRTDAEGKYSFVPDARGKWHLVVDDGMGHRKGVDVSVDGTSFAVSDSSAPTLLRLAFGAILLSALGFFVARLSRKQKAPSESTVEGA